MTGKRLRLGFPLIRVEHTGVTADDVERIVEANPTTTFKLKIDSCFSGRFIEALTQNGKPRHANLLIIEASSAADQISLSRGTRFRNEAYPQRLGTFTRGNLVGLTTWASSPEEVQSSAALGGSLLAHALERAFVLGRSANIGIDRGKIPVIVANLAPPPAGSVAAANGHRSRSRGRHRSFRARRQRDGRGRRNRTNRGRRSAVVPWSCGRNRTAERSRRH